MILTEYKVKSWGKIKSQLNLKYKVEERYKLVEKITARWWNVHFWDKSNKDFYKWHC